jgi:hypothetical protein
VTTRPAPDLLKKQFPLIGENLLSGVVTMRTLLILAAIIGFSVSALAQTAAPKHSGKPLKQAKPKAPMACTLVGTVKGTKLWAGDCLSPPELRETLPTAEPAAPAPTPEAVPPGAKQ